MTDNSLSPSQIIFEEIISKIPQNTRKYHIPANLHGPIDLRTLDVQDRRPIEISFSNGGITELLNAPVSIRILRIDNNQLNSLPVELKDLNVCSCNNNKITNLNSSYFQNLEELHINNNQISGHLGNLPPNLKIFKIDGNKIEELDMQNASKCTDISCRNNSNLKRIINIKEEQAGTNGFVCNHDPNVEISYIEDDSNDDFIGGSKSFINNNEAVENSLDYYYKLKNRYENERAEKVKAIVRMPIEMRNKKKMVRAIKRKCINCGKDGGTTFWRQNDVLRAQCSAAKPGDKCELNLNVPVGFYSNIYYLLKITKEDMDEKQENIMRLKMDTLFNYITETASSKRFKKELETYQSDEAMMHTYKEYEENMVRDPVRERLTQKKSHEIQRILKDVRKMMETYNETGDKRVLRDAVEKQANELLAEIDALRDLQYPIMEMMVNADGERVLYQSKYKLENLDYKLVAPDVSETVIRTNIDL
jgi:hypothetical protein